jgi:hypothetical protein
MRINHGLVWLAATVAGSCAGIAMGYAIASSVL